MKFKIFFKVWSNNILYTRDGLLSETKKLKAREWKMIHHAYSNQRYTEEDRSDSDKIHLIVEIVTRYKERKLNCSRWYNIYKLMSTSQ